MSQTKFVAYGDRGWADGAVPPGFWAYDVALNVFLKHLINAAQSSEQVDTAWLSSVISDWRLACVPDFGLTLETSWSLAQWQTFLALAEEACARLAARESIPFEEIVSWQILEDLRLHTRGAPEVFTAPVVELGRAIIALVSRQLPEAPEGQIWLYGAPEGRMTIGWMQARSPGSDAERFRGNFSLLSTVRAFFQRLKK